MRQVDRQPSVAVIDIPVDHMFRRRSVALAILLGGAGAIVGLIICTIAVFPGGISTAPWIIALPVFIVLGIGLVVTNHANKRRVAKIFSDPSPDLCKDVEWLIEPRGFEQPTEIMRQFLRELGKRRQTPRIIRLWPGDRLVPIAPLEMPFEPISLDESDSAFDELSDALGDGVIRGSGNRYEGTGLRRVKRNMALTGIGGMLIVVGCYLFSAGIEGFSHRTPTSLFWIYLLFMTTPLFRILGRPAKPQEWFLVPGALIMRRVRRWSKATTVHIFNAQHAHLCAYRVARKQWGFIVADAEQCITSLATKRELDLLLRAWLSPLPPPTREQMHDLLAG